MRADHLDVTLMIQQLANPPQGDEYRELFGDLFPEKYPFDYARIYTYQYFWLKYYMSQRNLFAIPRQPMYANYEVLCNAFATKIIDFSQAEIFKIKSSEIGKKDFEEFLMSNNQYTLQKFQERFNVMVQLEQLDKELLEREVAMEKEKVIIESRQNKQYAEIKQKKSVHDPYARAQEILQQNQPQNLQSDKSEASMPEQQQQAGVEQIIGDKISNNIEDKQNQKTPSSSTQTL
eukprot:403371027